MVTEKFTDKATNGQSSLELVNSRTGPDT